MLVGPGISGSWTRKATAGSYAHYGAAGRPRLGSFGVTFGATRKNRNRNGVATGRPRAKGPGGSEDQNRDRAGAEARASCRVSESGVKISQKLGAGAELERRRINAFERRSAHWHGGADYLGLHFRVQRRGNRPEVQYRNPAGPAPIRLDFLNDRFFRQCGIVNKSSGATGVRSHTLNRHGTHRGVIDPATPLVPSTDARLDEPSIEPSM